ncbi:hypothetical protein N7504_004893 [Penicillium tannophilum]|nr:hypothetical protein N7504_004893 [Penicillium tannophilum]
MDDDVNSSDFEFEPPVNKQSTAGQASIAEIVANSTADRFLSKKRVKQLQFGNGAPGTRSSQNLWVRRFEAFRRYTLKQDLTIRFTGDDVIRFFETIIGKMKSRASDKPAVNKKTVIDGFRILLAYGVFTWEDFKFTRHDESRFQTWIDDTIQEGRLLNGASFVRTWIGFATLSRMIRSFIEHKVAKGCWSWDIVVAKCFSVTLVAGLGVRSGDVARSAHYADTYCLHWEDVRLYIEGQIADIKHLRAEVTLKTTKGLKDSLNKDIIFYLRPLDDADCHACPVTWMLVHALRHGLVLGTTLSDVLKLALLRPDHVIQWTYPSYPVLTAFTKSSHRCDLAQPARTHQLLYTIKEMGLIAKILGRIYMHATRLGAIRDVTHLPKIDEGSGFVTDIHRQIMHHDKVTLTENYSGGHTRELYNDRAANQAKRHRREPVFSADSAIDVFNAPVTEQEIVAWNDENGDRKIRTQKRNRIIKRQRLTIFKDDAVPENRFTSDGAQPPMLEKSASAINARPMPIMSQGTIIPIDPSILDDEGSLEATEVPIMDVNLLQATIFDQANDPTTAGGHNDSLPVVDESERLFLGLDEDEGTTAMPTTEFIGRYARLNIVLLQAFARKWRALARNEPSDVSLHSVTGNSRDEPTPFVFHCHNHGCSYETIIKDTLQQHERACSGHRRGGDVVCPHANCGKSFTNQKCLIAHIRRTHQWVAKPCEHGCEPTKVYSTFGSYEYHIRMAHKTSDKWPCRCRYPGCKKDKTYMDSGSLRTHLAHAHGLATTAQMIPYLPSVPKTKPVVLGSNMPPETTVRTS